jgi:hypothetical protein
MQRGMTGLEERTSMPATEAEVVVIHTMRRNDHDPFNPYDPNNPWIALASRGLGDLAAEIVFAAAYPSKGDDLKPSLTARGRVLAAEMLAPMVRDLAFNLAREVQSGAIKPSALE